MKTKTLIQTLFASLTLLFIGLMASPLSAQSALNSYISEGLSSNLVLQQKSISWEQAQQSLQVAKSYFLPSVNILGDYTSGEGGRSIAIPVGDLLNPVYASLNQITQSDAFPQIANVNQNFFPKNFYDGRIRTSVPLVNTDLYMNRSIQGQQVAIKQYELAAYRRQLVYDIKEAYFTYLSATSAAKIFESALKLVNKNVEVNESLLRNGKAVPANYLRSKSEAEGVKASLASAENKAVNAKKYFNFLLNRDLDSDVSTEYVTTDDPSQFPPVLSIDGREELQMIRAQMTIAQTGVKMSKLARLPKVNAFLDLGSQASNWEWNHNSMYYLFGVQLTMPVFQGFRNVTAVRQNTLEVNKADLGLRYATQQLSLAVTVASNDLQTAVQNYAASREQSKSAQSYYNLIEKGYQQGINTLIEFLDARNQLTSSQLQQSLKLFGMLTAAAKLERETASYNFEK